MVSEKQALGSRACAILDLLTTAVAAYQPPACVSIVSKFGRDPYLVLVSCLLSLRTKDTVSEPASYRLFVYARTPESMCTLPVEQIEQLIYPVGFYRKKARLIIKLSHDLITRFASHVPQSEKDLLSLAGVGRKTMNLVRAEGFDEPALCVDVHVHRIANRLGIVQTNTPHETEIALCALLPRNRWRECNRLFVVWGQNICVPVSPRCSTCVVRPLCERRGVTRSR